VVERVLGPRDLRVSHRLSRHLPQTLDEDARLLDESKHIAVTVDDEERRCVRVDAIKR
jgi:hypothetical protein